MNDKPIPPILRHKHHDAPSVFAPDGLLREARRQKGLAEAQVPELCLLDPDGDIVRHLTATGAARVSVPMLLLHGADDPLCPVQGSERFFEQLRVEPRRLHTYPGLRHEIFNEPERDQVLADLVTWIREVEAAVAS